MTAATVPGRSRTRRSPSLKISAKLRCRIEFGELVQTLRGAVRDGADVRAVLEGCGRCPQRGGEIGHGLRDRVLAGVDIDGRLLAGRVEEAAPPLDGGVGSIADLFLERVPIWPARACGCSSWLLFS